MKTYEETLAFIKKAHAGQKDKAGENYWVHPYKVSQFVVGKDIGGGELEQIVALLHDVLEDTDYTYETLKKEGYDDSVLIPLVLLTKAKGEDYDVYLNRVELSPVSMRVKLADLKHNQDLNRLPVEDRNTEKVKNRMAKYARAEKRIREQLKATIKAGNTAVVFEYKRDGKILAIKRMQVVDAFGKYQTVTPDEVSRKNIVNIQIDKKDIIKKGELKGCVPVDKVKCPCGALRWYPSVDGANRGTSVVLAKDVKGERYKVFSYTSGSNNINLITTKTLRETIKEGHKYANLAVLNRQQGTFRGKGQIPEMELHLPVSLDILGHRVTKMAEYATQNPLNREKVAEIPLVGYPEGFVPVTMEEKNKAMEILSALDVSVVQQYVSQADRALLHNISHTFMAPKNVMQRFYKICENLRKVDKEQVAESLRLPQNLKKSKSFMSAFCGTSATSMIKNYKMYQDLEDDEAEVYNYMVENADKVTEMVESVTDDLGLQLYGLKYRVKSVSSFWDKLRNRDGCTDKKKELQKINDVIRFTTQIEDYEHYGALVNQSIDALKARGCTLKKCKNFWLQKGGTYKGVNCQFVSADGIPFEMQYHVPSYLNIKDEMHDWYELRRSKTTGIVKGSQRYEHCLHMEQELAETVKVPEDYELVENVG